MSDDNNLVESSVINGNFGCVQHKQHMLVLMNAVEFNVECMWNTSYAAIINSCTLFNVPSHFYCCCWFLVILFGKFRFAAFNELHLAYFHNKPVFSLACHLNTANYRHIIPVDFPILWKQHKRIDTVVKDEQPFFLNISIRYLLSQKFQFMQIVSNLNIYE